MTVLVLVALAAALLLAVLAAGAVLLRPLLPRRRGDEDDDSEVVLFGQPLGAPRSAAAEPPGPAAEAAATPGADVLLVTADAALRSTQRRLLAGRCRLRAAAPGPAVAAAVLSAAPDLVLVDAGAGGETALEVVRSLRSWAATEWVPVVLLGGDGGALDGEAGELRITDVVVDAARLPGLVGRAIPFWLSGAGVFKPG